MADKRLSRETMMIVDDDSSVGRALNRILRKEDRRILVCTSGEEALGRLTDKEVGVVISDQMMPGIDGVTLLEAIRYRRPDIVRVLMTGFSSESRAIEAINRSHIFSYITKPWRNSEIQTVIDRAFRHHEALLGQRDRLMTLTEDQGESTFVSRNIDVLQTRILEQVQTVERDAMVMLAQAAEAKDDDTGEHVQRLGRISRRICMALGLEDRLVEEIGFFSMVHDVGKIHVPDHILKKPGPLTPEEWDVMRQHTIYGEHILVDRPAFRIARQITRSHHERWDGKGYPDGLAASAIPLPARIVAVADVFDALTHERPYKPAWPVSQALAEIQEQSGKAFDPDVVQAFLKSVELEGRPANQQEKKYA